MILLSILVATLVGGVVSVLLASMVSLTILTKFADKMVAFAVGVLLTFALTDMLPEAVEQGLPLHDAGWILLAGIIAFFLLEKMALWRHGHHEILPHHKVSMIVIGDGLHNFVDGILIAAAFLTDPALGWAAAVTVMAHEIPQEISDFMVLLDSGLSKRRALFLNALSGAAMVLGGVLGWLALESAQAAIPVILVIAGSSFIYIAVADLVPELHRKRSLKDGAIQLGLILSGIATSLLAQHLHH
ncbi:ZIP family metal transporter [Methylobacillus arboreus]|uniref:ZIP family metal transporter n=1 Tax=Methylobacillus arboreus TaxID=755170 RepID=UPI001E448F47|nr:ZIP family metal transporter [Methylobacillus arboreus]MCB5190779.1 ZIP family metal transporter [Methylobacillus arboreus]